MPLDEARDELEATLAGSLPVLLHRARVLRDRGHGSRISYSRKVFVPLTRLCRDVCHYCTFATTPSKLTVPYLTPEQVLEIARAGEAKGCTEVLFTLGDKPELRYPPAADALAQMGHATTLSYLAEVCALVLKETTLLPHVNAGVMGRDDLAALRQVSASQGLMLESTSARLSAPGGPHFGSPDKDPSARLETIRLAGELSIPFTSGILIGIGETREERLDALESLRQIHLEYGHIQEIIIQNFRAKPNTRMSSAPEPSLPDLQWTIAAARMVFGPDMNIQAPPNLSPGSGRALLDAGISDFGGVSPVTPDHVNPEAPWPEIALLAKEAAAAGKVLTPRLPAYPSYIHQAERWFAEEVARRLRRAADSEGLARGNSWTVGSTMEPPRLPASEAVVLSTRSDVAPILDRVAAGKPPSEADLIALFAARGSDYDSVIRAADELRAATGGETVTFVVNRNINYTNMCTYRCTFCAFSKGTARSLRGTPYDLSLEEICRRAVEAWERGATEVCLQGGIHPDYTGQTYLDIVQAIRRVRSQLHIHAFSPLEISQGARSLGLPIREFLTRLKEAGLGSLPGTAAEILSDDVRAILCPDKLSTAQWLDVVRTAHDVGLPTTATIMFGHVDRPHHWARHLLEVRYLQQETGGFTEFVPLPFVHDEAPLYLKGEARRGPSYREAVLMHAVARLALAPLIRNIQTSWVKMGRAGAAAALAAGANDLGGTLMNESISRAAGAQHGQEFAPGAMRDLAASLGREARQRTTLYGAATDERQKAAESAAPLATITLDPPARRRHTAPHQAPRQ